MDLQARVERLDKLARGLAREVLLWKDCNESVLYQERKTYVGAIQDALAGVEKARVVLAEIRQRLHPKL